LPKTSVAGPSAKALRELRRRVGAAPLKEHEHEHDGLEGRQDQHVRQADVGLQIPSGDHTGVGERPAEMTG
jgi:hypothetical protein